MAIQSTMCSYSVTISGSSGCGKSAFMRRHATGKFNNGPCNMSTAKLVFYTNCGPITVHCAEEHVGIHTDAIIYMLDLTDHNLVGPHLIDEGIPKVLCGNKSDKISSISDEAMYSIIHGNGYTKYWPISVKSTYNFEKPFLYLLRELTGNQNLEFMVMT